jgi:hypothetical protein
MGLRKLKTLRDELWLQAHLAEMEAKSTWLVLMALERQVAKRASRVAAAVNAEVEGGLRAYRAARPLRRIFLPVLSVE